MDLKIVGKTNIKDMVIDFIEYINKNGELVSITWDKSSSSTTEIQFGRSFTGAYSCLCFGEKDQHEPKGYWNEIQNIDHIENIQVYNPYGHEDIDCFSLDELIIYGAPGRHTLTNPIVNNIIYT